MPNKPKIAIAIGDPAGIGPEIAIKAALDPAVRAVCDPILVGEANLLDRHAEACEIDAVFGAVARVGDADWSEDRIQVLNCARPAAIPFGAVSAAAGRASIAFCAAAIEAAQNREVAAVAAAPQNETSIAKAEIEFDGHPSFVARQTGTNPDDVFMMLACGDTRIAHVTLHRSVRDALALITAERVERAIRATATALRNLGIATPRIAVSGLNPHAGEGGLFGRDEIDVIAPAISAAKDADIDVSGPYGADTMFQKTGFDAFVVMLHDQGHIAAKLLAPNGAVAFSIGTPILFASVAHGTGHDIAGRGIADPAAMIDAVLRLAKAKAPTNP